MALQQLLGIELPIIQAPMGGRAGQRAGDRGVERRRRTDSAAVILRRCGRVRMQPAARRCRPRGRRASAVASA